MVAKAKKAGLVVGFVLLGAFGWVAAGVVKHLWIDHELLHVLVGIEQARQQKAAAASVIQPSGVSGSEKGATP